MMDACGLACVQLLVRIVTVVIPLWAALLCIKLLAGYGIKRFARRQAQRYTARCGLACRTLTSPSAPHRCRP